MKFDVRSFSLALFMSGTVFPVSAQIFDVTTTLDRQDAMPGDGLCQTADNACSLRAAVQEANALGGGHVINLSSAEYALALAGRNEDQAAMGDLDISAGEITINGVSALETAINGLRADRVFDVISGKLILNDLTIANGLPYDAIVGEGSGGGINNKGQLVLRRVDLRDNEASTGGGIHNTGFGRSVSVIDSVIRNNNGKGSGGAIRNLLGSVNIINSSIKDNIAFVGGGVWNSTGYVTINRSEFSGNSTNTEGGAVYMDGGPRGAFTDAVVTLNVTNSSISGNSAAQNGAGIYLTAGNGDNFLVKLTHTTLANNTSAGGPDTAYDASVGGSGIYAGVGYNVEFINSVVADNVSSLARHTQCRSVDRNQAIFSDKPVISTGVNYVGDGSCGFTPNSSINLGAAVNLGGPTDVVPVLAGSVAIDASSVSCATEDQRGYLRTDTDNLCDAGAYEFNGTTPPPPADPMVLTAPLVVSTATLQDTGGQIPVIEASSALLLSPGETTVTGFSFSSSSRPVTTFLMESEPAQGTVQLQIAQSGLLTMTFNADAGATGSDSLIFRACDDLICSERVEIDIHYSDLGSVDGGSYSPPTAVAASLDDYGWVDGENFDQAYPDTGYTHLGGVFFYRLSNVSGLGATLLVDVPQGVDLPNGAAVRVLRNDGEWVAMGGALVDSANRTVTLTIFDNIEFDSDARVGEVSGQVAIAVIGGGSTGGDSGSGSSDTGGDSGSGSESSSGDGSGSSSSDTVTLDDGSVVGPAPAGGGGGGGALGWMLVMLLTVLVGRRGRRLMY